MRSLSKKDRLHSAALKAISLLAGFGFWYFFGALHNTTEQITIPVYFYNVPADAMIKAPETITAQICGKRDVIRALDQSALAMHIDAQTLHQGSNLLTADHATIFLPEALKLVHYVPSNPTIELYHKDHQET